MHKKHSASHLRLVVSDIMINGYEILQALNKEISDIKPGETDPVKLEHLQRTMGTFMIVNHVIHPGHDVSLTMLPGAAKLIEALMKDYEHSVQRKIIMRDKCYSCVSKGLK